MQALIDAASSTYILPTAIGDALVSLPAIRLMQEATPQSTHGIIARPELVPLLSLLNLGGASIISSDAITSGCVESCDVVVDFASTTQSESIVAALSPMFCAQHCFDREGQPWRGYLINGEIRPPLAFVSGWESSQTPIIETAWMLDVGLSCAVLGIPMVSEQHLQRLFCSYIPQRPRRGRRAEVEKVMLLPGGSSELKKWPALQWEQLANKLLRDGFSVSVAIGAEDHDPLPSDLNHLVISNADLGVLGRLMQQTDLIIANDCGTMHAACILGCSVIAIFGPTNEDIWFPYRRRDRVAIRSGPRNDDRAGQLSRLDRWPYWPTDAQVYGALSALLGR